MRFGNRSNDCLRPVSILRHYTKYAEGSVLISMGETKVLCCASVENSVPPFLKGKGSGWITAEYSMLPRSTHTRSVRESSKGKVSGRTHEIQRLIGRSMRAVVDLVMLGERTVIVDCDVIQADGGTRTASITGACVALHDALHKLVIAGELPDSPLREHVAAVSVGLLNDEFLLDLDYAEDSAADVDMNFVMTTSGCFIEVQGTAEKGTFTCDQMDSMRDLAVSGITRLLDFQRVAFEP